MDTRVLPNVDYTVRGLSQQEVQRSRREFGENTITKQKRKSFLRQFAASFGDPVIKILMIVLGINIVVMFRNFDWYETAGIAISILIATLVSTISEYGSETAFLTLQENAKQARCRIKRAEGVREVLISEVVTGDLVLLQAGERIPADGVLIVGKLSVDQSALNGETKEAQKLPGFEHPEVWDTANTHQLFHGSMVTTGEGLMRVVNVGDATIYGHMARQMQEETRESPLKLRLNALTKTISRLGYIAAALVIFADLFNALVLDNGFDMQATRMMVSDFPTLFSCVIHALMLGITVVVVSVPEGLPMMITVVLSSNMKRMLKDNVLVRKLVGIETAGSMNLLFTDKTGTLTKGRLQVSSFVCGNGKSFDTARMLPQPLMRLTGLSGLYNTASLLSGGRIIGGNATDSAMMAYVLPLLEFLPRDVTRTNVVPFDSDYKFSAVCLPDENVTLVKGAPELILQACTHYYDELGERRPLPASGRIKSIWHERAALTERVLALATSQTPINEQSVFEGLTLIGLVCIRDEIRKECPSAIKQIQQAGIQVVMVTGDNKETALAVAQKIGLSCNDGGIALTSAELASKTDEQLKTLLPRLRVVARALPTDKSRLVRIAQEMGQVVGMTGDGINDAPALKKADIGFAMGTGTEVAKEAGDIVILNNNISSISKAILYGRTVFKSIRKFIVFQLTMNLCAVGVSLAGPFIGIDTPVTVVQMLWINMIMDTLGGLAFSGEAPLEEYMREKPKRRDEAILNSYMMNQIVFTGGFTMLLCISFLCSKTMRALFLYDEMSIYFLTAFFALFIFCGVFNSFNARTHRINLLGNLHKNKPFMFIMLLIVAVQINMIYFGGTVFRTTALPPRLLAFVVLIAFMVVPMDMLRKIFLKKMRKTRNY